MITGAFGVLALQGGFAAHIATGVRPPFADRCRLFGVHLKDSYFEYAAKPFFFKGKGDLASGY